MSAKLLDKEGRFVVLVKDVAIRDGFVGTYWKADFEIILSTNSEVPAGSTRAQVVKVAAPFVGAVEGESQLLYPRYGRQYTPLPQIVSLRHYGLITKRLKTPSGLTLTKFEWLPVCVVHDDCTAMKSMAEACLAEWNK